ncbi:hypothetical protein ACHHYP_20609 [Achlya hypogyna]|uniref:Uncharacterized protein n=1 Tax=Achlya hypogyna TaxID=1202772 RepID=A0A1V9YHA5_ACHHY|nr:hypothetical protein ACHHYP_20609 [Achlya hypogyna]
MDAPEIVARIARYVETPAAFVAFLKAMPPTSLGAPLQSARHLACMLPASDLWPHLALGRSSVLQKHVEAVNSFMGWHGNLSVDENSQALLNQLPPLLQPLQQVLSRAHLHLTLRRVTGAQVHFLAMHHGDRIRSLSISVLEPGNGIRLRASMARIGQALGLCPHLSTFHLYVDHPSWDGTDLQPIFDRLKDSDVTDWRLYATGYRGELVTDKCSAALVEWLYHAPVVAFAWVDPEPYETKPTPALHHLVRALTTSTSIRVVDLSLSKALLTTWATTRTRVLPRSLKKLVLEYPHAPETYLTSLGQRIALSHVSSVDLTWNPCLCIDALAPYLPRMHTLSTLNLSHCYLMIEGGKRLAQLLPQLGALTTLVLTANDLFDEGVKAVMQSVPACPKLAKLRLDRNHLTDGSFAAVVLACRACPDLRNVDLSENLFKSTTIRRLHRKPDVISMKCAIWCPLRQDMAPSDRKDVHGVAAV